MDSFNQTEEYADLDKLCNEVLTALEVQELRLLQWGFVDVRSDLDTQLPKLLTQLSPLGQHMWEEAQIYEVLPEHILTNLKERRLVFTGDLPQGQRIYRSRFAETIRLLALLRQLFPDKNWQTAPRMVSDYKIDLKPRTYPKRDTTIDDLRAGLNKKGASPLYIQAIENLLQKPDGSYLKLARFQKEAILQQYMILHGSGERAEQRDRGLVVGAGTGSGKTKAFYVPAMATIAETMTNSFFTRALALYPRVELLKDQLVEAFREARKLDEFLATHKLRLSNTGQQVGITIGAYYGDTLFMAKNLLDSEQSGWKPVSAHRKVSGWECPFFACPDPSCEHNPKPLVWYREDVEKEVKENEQGNFGSYAQLRCPECSFKMGGNQLLLTRRQMVLTPPDILFTTTEMLNRRLLRAGEHELFGIDIKNKPLPRMLLLDEIHTYEGLNGAHVAYLLRRWRHARRRHRYDPLCCVGLSATLNNAADFFANLIGIPASLVNYIHPEVEDMEEEGAEYNLVLKGDPVSGANLLSTSVQTVMLLARMLDISRTNPSREAYGQKVFAFTDKLDVINRWYYIEQDAEMNNNLSKLRKPSRTDSHELKKKKFASGQDWTSCENIGHNLEQPLIVGLTSSQYRGVKANANLIIATSTLEVGFNDPTVGAVVQHKAPRSLASFLQRKGRAGRSRLMRPWMVVVTSAYGRDRWAFQHAEQLFSPILNNIHLPIENYYVRKIQATFAFMDWLSLELKRDQECRYIDIWDVLSSSEEKRNGNLSVYRKKVCDLIEDVLNGGPLRERLSNHLQQALSLRDERAITTILWDEPRSLMFEVLPTILRQLESTWQRLDHREGWDIQIWADNIARSPLPDFVTPNLFSDLKAINIPIYLPPDPPEAKVKLNTQSENNRRQKPEEQTLPLAQCMSEFAPGNVSKRYTRHNMEKASQKNQDESHWIPIPDGPHLKQDTLPIDKLSITYDDAPTTWEIAGKQYLLYRPRTYSLKRLPEKVQNTSSASLVWKSHFIGKTLYSSDVTDINSVGQELFLTKTSKWKNFFASVRSYTQANGSWVEIARLATGVHAETRSSDRNSTKRHWLTFCKGEHAAGIGFIHYVDAIQFQVRPLDTQLLLNNAAWPQLYRHLKPEYFLHRLCTNAYIIKTKLSIFEIEWLWQLELSMLVATAIGRSVSLQVAAEEVQTKRAQLAKHTMNVIFQSQQIDEDEKERTGRLQAKLQTLIGEAEIEKVLNEEAQVLWSEPDQRFSDWLQRCYVSSLGHAVFAALTHMVPNIDPDDLIMDIDGTNIWVSEVTPGGIGIISRITETFGIRPDIFDLQMLDTLQYCDRQEIAVQLHRIADLIREGDKELQEGFALVRDAPDLSTQTDALEMLKALLEQRGIPATRELVVSLHARFLRSNTDIDTDELIVHLTHFWYKEEERLGCDIDLRVIAVAANKSSEVNVRVTNVLKRIGESEQSKDYQVFNVLQSLLWLPCVNSCPDCIEEVSYYQEPTKPSRALISVILPEDVQVVAYDQGDWQTKLQGLLSTTYNAQVICDQDQLAQCKQALQKLLVQRIEVGFQFFYPIIERISRNGRKWAIELKIRELIHG